MLGGEVASPLLPSKRERERERERKLRERIFGRDDSEARRSDLGFGDARRMAIDREAVRVDLPSPVARRKVQRTN